MGFRCCGGVGPCRRFVWVRVRNRPSRRQRSRPGAGRGGRAGPRWPCASPRHDYDSADREPDFSSSAAVRGRPGQRHRGNPGPGRRGDARVPAAKRRRRPGSETGAGGCVDARRIVPDPPQHGSAGARDRPAMCGWSVPVVIVGRGPSPRFARVPGGFAARVLLPPRNPPASLEYPGGSQPGCCYPPGTPLHPPGAGLRLLAPCATPEGLPAGREKNPPCQPNQTGPRRRPARTAS